MPGIFRASLYYIKEYAHILKNATNHHENMKNRVDIAVYLFAGYAVKY